MAGLAALRGWRPSVVWRYLTRQIALPFCIIFAILLFALSLERLLRLVDMATAQDASMSRVFVLMGYLMPHYMTIALPASFFLAALLGVRSLQDRLELAILQSAGISLRQLLAPLLVMSAFVMGATLLLSGSIDPVARYAYRGEMYRLSASGQFLNLQPGMFVRASRNMTVRADKVGGQGRALSSVFVSDQERDGATTYITARSARVDKDEASGRVTMLLRDGTLLRDAGPGTAPRPLSFAEYRIMTPAARIHGPRGRDEREMTLTELMSGHAPGGRRSSTRAEETAELHARLVQAASIPLLTLLALPFALMGGGRTGKAYGVAAGIILLILYDKVMGFGAAAAAAGHVSPWLSLWVPWLLLGAAGQAMLAWKAPRQLKGAGSAAASANKTDVP